MVATAAHKAQVQSQGQRTIKPLEAVAPFIVLLTGPSRGLGRGLVPRAYIVRSEDFTKV